MSLEDRLGVTLELTVYPENQEDRAAEGEITPAKMAEDMVSQ